MQVFFCEAKAGVVKFRSSMKSNFLVFVAVSLLGIAAFYGVSSVAKSQNNIVAILEAQIFSFKANARLLGWGKHLSKDYRFFLLKTAASRPRVRHFGGGLMESSGPPAYEMDPDLIREILPEYNLSVDQEQEILKILKAREAKE